MLGDFSALGGNNMRGWTSLGLALASLSFVSHYQGKPTQHSRVCALLFPSFHSQTVLSLMSYWVCLSVSSDLRKEEHIPGIQ